MYNILNSKNTHIGLLYKFGVIYLSKYMKGFNDERNMCIIKFTQDG